MDAERLYSDIQTQPWEDPISTEHLNTQSDPNWTHASVNISHYKHIIICVINVHIAYQPISAGIYFWAAYSRLAQEYNVCYMCVGQHICNLAKSMWANQHFIFLCWICVGQHICIPTAGMWANSHLIFLCWIRVGWHICIPTESMCANHHVIFLR